MFRTAKRPGLDLSRKEANASVRWSAVVAASFRSLTTGGRRHRISGLIASAMLLALSSASGAAQERASDPAMIKAQSIYKLTYFIHWPKSSFETPHSSFHICVASDDPTGTALRQVSGRNVAEHQVEIRALPRPDSMAGCHVVWLGNYSPDGTQKWISAAQDHPVLLVGEGEDLLRHGGMISIYSVNRGTHLVANFKEFQKSGLSMETPLMMLLEDVN